MLILCKKNVKYLMLLSIFFISLSKISYAQQLDEKRKLLAEVKDASYYDSTLMFCKGQEALMKYPGFETKAEIYIYYGSYYFYIENNKKALEYFKLSQEESKKANSLYLSNLAKIRQAFLEYENGDHVVAEKKLEILLEKAELNKDYRNIAEIYNFKGIIFETKNEFKKAAEIYYKGLLLAEEQKLEYYPGVFKNNIGLIKLFSGETDFALKELEEGLVLAEKENNLRLAHHLKLNICLCYIFKKEYDKTTEYFDQVIKYAKHNNLPTELSHIYINFGSIMLNDNNFDKANSYYDSAVAILSTNDLLVELTVAYFGKARVYLKMGKYPEAEEYLNKAYKIILSTNKQENYTGYYSLLYELQLAQKKYKEALESYENYINVRDSLKEQINNKVIEDLQYNYKVQQKEIELEKERAKSILLEISNEREKNVKWLSIGIAIIIIVAILIFFYNRYLRKLKEKQEQFSRLLIQNIEEERKRISMDLHDDIGQTLSVIKSKVVNNLNEEKKEEIQEDISKIINQTREISRNLYPSSLEKIGIIRAIAVLMEDLQAIKGLECSYEIDEGILNFSKEVQTNLYRIIQECVNNTVKHSGATGLKVTIEKNNDEFIFTYKDNGTGIKFKKNSKGIGLLSIQERVKILKGSLEIDEKNDRGFKLILRFKI